MEPARSAWRTDTSAPTGYFPEDVLHDTSRRLSLLCVVAASLWTVALLIANLLPPDFQGTLDNHPYPWPGNLVGGLAIATAVAMFAYVRLAPDRQRKLDLGVGFLIVNAFAVGLLDEWAAPPDRIRSVSWIAVIILTYAMIAPTTPGKTLAGCLVAASMDPLGALITFLRGAPSIDLREALPLYWPNYAAAILAVVPSQVIQRLGRQIRRAREAGSYELVEALGKGGMGEVWRAEHRLLARPAAVKIVRPEVLGAASDRDVEAILRRFKREAQATAVLSSPHTIDIYDFGVNKDGDFYYVMELLHGRDLESLVLEFGPLQADRAVYLLRQVCHSLAEAHTRGLVHRDIKPANVYVCRMGLDYDFVKVLDFGLVKFSSPHAAGASLLKTDRITTGTPAYMAPEVILGEAEVDRRADVYSLGCVAYWMLTGELVFQADTAMKMLVEHIQSRPDPPSARTELAIPRELDELILSCLEKDPARRPQDAEALFEMACGCRTCNGWTREDARLWWERNLPELTAPPVLAMPAASGSPATADSLMTQ